MRDEIDEAIFRILEDLSEGRIEVWAANVRMPQVEIDAGKWLLEERYLTSVGGSTPAGRINPHGLRLYEERKEERQPPPPPSTWLQRHRPNRPLLTAGGVMAGAAVITLVLWLFNVPQ